MYIGVRTEGDRDRELSMSNPAGSNSNGIELGTTLSSVRIKMKVVLDAEGEGGIRTWELQQSEVGPTPPRASVPGRAARGRSLPAWLEESKSALAASQADQLETQRRISRLQELTRGLSIIDNHECVGVGSDESESVSKMCPVERNCLQLHSMTLGIIGHVASFLEPQSMLRYCTACRAAGKALRQDECWGQAFRLRHLRIAEITQLPSCTASLTTKIKPFLGKQADHRNDSGAPSSDGSTATMLPDVVTVAPASLSSGAGTRTGKNGVSCDVAGGDPFFFFEKESSTVPNDRFLEQDPARRDEMAKGPELRPFPPSDAPMRRAVVAHACLLSRAVRLFNTAVMDGGTAKAVINGPVRTATAVASLRALVELTADPLDPVGRRPFSGAKTGQLLLSIVREHRSAVLQELACAALANLVCKSMATGSDFPGESVSGRLLGRSKGSAVRALTSLCSSTRPALATLSLSKSRGGLQAVENLPGRQASRALVNLLLPRHQIAVKDTRSPSPPRIVRRRSPPVPRSSDSEIAGALQKCQASEGLVTGGAPQGVRGAGSPGLAWAAEATNEGTSASVPNDYGAAEDRTGEIHRDLPSVVGAPRVLQDGLPKHTATAVRFIENTTAADGKELLLEPAAVRAPRTVSAREKRTQPMAALATAATFPGARQAPPQRSDSLPTVFAATHGGFHNRGGASYSSRETGVRLNPNPLTPDESSRITSMRTREETWEAFYFYHSGNVKDTFVLTLDFSDASEGSVTGRGTDKLGPFVMEGRPVLCSGGEETWLIRKTYTDRGVPDAHHGTGRAHVTHIAYSLGMGATYASSRSHSRRKSSVFAPTAGGDDLPLSSAGLTDVKTPPGQNLACHRTGFWGVWERVLSKGGEGGGISEGAVGTTKLSRRGGVFRLVRRSGSQSVMGPCQQCFAGACLEDTFGI